MVVIADTSPLNYLVLIDAIAVLPALYGHVLITATVLAELQDKATPELVADWVAKVPPWVQVVPTPPEAHVLEETLDAGESSAIVLAERHRPNVLLLMDDTQGRAEARRRQLRVTGTLGVLEAAADQGLLDLPTAFARLRATTFRATERLLADTLTRHQTRQRQ